MQYKNLIVLEGTDGSGKATQAEYLLALLRRNGYQAELYSAPFYNDLSSGPVRLLLEGRLGDRTAAISPFEAAVPYTADRLMHKNSILDDLERGAVVVLDRWTDSTLIHHAMKFDTEQETEAFAEWLWDLEHEKCGIPEPGLTLYLDMPASCAAALRAMRMKKEGSTGTDISEADAAYQENASRCGRALAKKYGWTRILCGQESGEPFAEEEISGLIGSVVLEHLKKED